MLGFDSLVPGGCLDPDNTALYSRFGDDQFEFRGTRLLYCFVYSDFVVTFAISMGW